MLPQVQPFRPFLQGRKFFRSGSYMKRFFKSINVRELLRPLGQLLFFSLGSTVVLSAIVLVLALILDRPWSGRHFQDR